MATIHQCRRSRRRHEADSHWPLSLAAHAAVEVALVLVTGRVPGGPRPAVEVLWVAVHLTGTELIAWLLLHRRR